MADGVVKWFNDEKGYGFIGREDGPDLFVHHTGIDAKGHRTLVAEQVVEFEVGAGAKGPEARNVRVVE